MVKRKHSDEEPSPAKEEPSPSVSLISVLPHDSAPVTLFSYLTAKDLLRFRFTCTAAKESVKDHAKDLHVAVSRKDDICRAKPESIERLLSIFPNVTHLNVGRYSDIKFSDLLALLAGYKPSDRYATKVDADQVRQLKKLTYKGDSHCKADWIPARPLDEDFFSSSFLKELTHLDLLPGPFFKMGEMFWSRSERPDESMKQERRGLILRQLTCSPSLEYIRLKDIWDLKDEHMEEITNRLSNLKCFKLEGNVGLVHPNLKSNSITELVVNGYGASHQTLSKISVGMPNLVSAAITDHESLEQVNIQAPSMKRLDLSSCVSLRPTEIEGEFSIVEHLVLNETRYTKSQWNEFTRQFKQLKKVEFYTTYDDLDDYDY